MLSNVQKIASAMEADICDWLQKNPDAGHSKRRKEILQYFASINLSPEMAMELAAHMLIRIGDAHKALAYVRQFEPVLTRKFDINRINRRSSKLPRKREGKELRNEIRAIMRREKRNGLSFGDFLKHGLSGHIENLTIRKMADKKYKLFTEEFKKADAIKWNKSSMKIEYSKAAKPKKSNKR